MNESPVNIGENLGMEAAFLQAQKLARLGYYRWSKSCQEIIECNEEYRSILGLPPAPFATHCSGVDPLLHPDDRKRVLQAHRMAETTGGPVQLEFRIVRPDGAIRYLRDYNQPEPNGGRLPETWFGTVQDITDLRERDEELRQNRAALDQAMRLARLAHYRWSMTEERYIELSDTFFEIMGLPVERPLHAGDYLDPLVHPDDLPRLIRQRGTAETEGRQIDLEYRVIRPDGEVRYLHEIAEIKRDKNGAEADYFGTLQDVS